jgi:hypothetical protein
LAGLPKCVEGAGQKEVHVPMSGAAGGNSNGRVDVDSDMQDATSDVSQLSEDEFDAILDAAFDQLVTDFGRQVRAEGLDGFMVEFECVAKQAKHPGNTILED